MRSFYSMLIFGLAALLVCFPSTFVGQERISPDKKPPESYRVQLGDKLSIKFFSHPELNEPAIVVRPDGFIGLQVVDEIRAEGRTVAELKRDIEHAYVEILLDPIISVSLVEFVTPHIFIGGQVNKPGRYDMREAKTLVQAIFLAGGFTRDARRSMVLHARPDGHGDWIIKTSNVSKILDPRGDEKDRELLDGDFIFVPDSKISQINKAVETFRNFVPRFF